MNTKKTRRRYTREFKLEAIRLTERRGGKVTEVVNNLGIHPNVLERWMREFRDDRRYAFPGNGNLRTPDEEIRLLKRRLREAEEERDILKKALAIFSKKNLDGLSIHFRSSGSVSFMAIMSGIICQSKRLLSLVTESSG